MSERVCYYKKSFDALPYFVRLNKHTDTSGGSYDAPLPDVQRALGVSIHKSDHPGVEGVDGKHWKTTLPSGAGTLILPEVPSEFTSDFLKHWVQMTHISKVAMDDKGHLLTAEDFVAFVKACEFHGQRADVFDGDKLEMLMNDNLKITGREVRQKRLPKDKMALFFLNHGFYWSFWANDQIRTIKLTSGELSFLGELDHAAKPGIPPELLGDSECLRQLGIPVDV